MEMEEIQSCKRSRIGNGVTGRGNNEAAKLGQKKEPHQDEDEDDGEGIKPGVRLRVWQQHSSSRICRVSRASGGKDRHSKVLTATGPRDRRIRLSVSTAIQFYDLQDRLGYDQPSKAVEWLIKAAAAAISELPSLEGAFPDLVTMNDQKPRLSLAEENGELNQQHFSLSKSACSSTSETSKGSVLSLSRSESRVKARERARERAAKEREKERQEADLHMNPSPNHPQGSFTELLIGGGNQHHSPVTIAQANPGAGGFFHKHSPITSTTDYFGQAAGGLFGQAQKPHQHPGIPHFTNCSPMGMGMAPSYVAAAGDHHEQQQQQFSFLQDHLIPVAAVAAGGGDYSVNFSISSGLAGFNRGTLQSNSPSTMPYHHLQRLSSSSPVDGSNLPFFFSAAAPAGTASGENQFPPSLHLCYGDGYRHSDLKGKGKS